MALVDIGSTLNTLWVFIMVGSGIGICIVSVIIFRKQMKYNIPVEILDTNTETGVPLHKIDSGGIFFDRSSGMRLFFLKKHKVGLKPDEIPYCQTEWNGFFKKRKKVYLYQLGFKSFAYMKPSISNPSLMLTVGDEDVAWAELAIERGNRLFLNTLLQQMLPYIGLMILSLVLIVMTVYFFKNLGSLETLVDKLGILTDKLNAGGTTIIGG